MTNLHNKWLHKAIVEILIPVLQDRGFAWHKQRPAREVGREIVLGLPFGSMRRTNTNSVDIVEISLKKGDRSYFVLHAGSVPLKGARSWLTGRHYDADKIEICALEESWTMVNCKRLYALSYFGFRFKSLRTLSQEDYQDLIRRVVSYLPEIDDALRDGIIGPHMICEKFPRRYDDRNITG